MSSFSFTGTARGEFEAVLRVERGLPTGILDQLLRAGLMSRELERLVISRRALQLRRAHRQRLTAEQSSRAMRLARILELAEQTFGERERALRWLRKPKRQFSGRAPLDLLATEAGGRVIEEMLYRIDDGILG